jgi:hypothetical protein
MLDQNLLKAVLDKQAAAKPAYDLPGGEWYKGLLPQLGYHQAGRAQVVAEADPKHVKKPGATVRSPYLTDIAAGLAGTTGGALAGAGIGAGIDAALGNDPFDSRSKGWPRGTILGTAAGGLLAALAISIQRQREVARITSEFTKPDPAEVRRIAEMEQKRSGLLHVLGGVLATGSRQAGRGEQLRSFVEPHHTPIGGVFGGAGIGGLMAQVILGNHAQRDTASKLGLA